MRRWQLITAGTLALGVATAAGLLVVAGRDDGPVVEAETSTKPTEDPAAVAERRIMTEMRAVLAVRAKAVLGGRLDDFLATVDPAEPALRAEQAQAFRNLREIGIASLSYGLREGYVPERLPRKGPGVYAFRVTMRVQVRGVDRAPRFSMLGHTYVHRGSKWLLTADDDFGPDSEPSWYREPWDYGAIDVVRRPSVVVVVSAGERRYGERLATMASAAFGDVRASIGRAPRAILVAALRDKRLIGPGAVTGGHPAAAVAVPDFSFVNPSDRGDAKVEGSHVVIQPQYRFQIDRGVLAHEFTHAAMAPRGATTPTWMVEGLAEYVQSRSDIRAGYGDTVDRRRRAVLRESIAGLQVLPIDGVFHGTYGEDNYGISWVLVEYLATKYGIGKVLAAYTDLGRDTNAATNQDPVLRKRFGIGEQQLVAAVHRYRGP